MPASSFSVAIAALSASSRSLYSPYLDHVSLQFFRPCLAKPSVRTPTKPKIFCKRSLFSSAPCSLLKCASSSFGSFEVNQEDGPASMAEGGELEEEENPASQSVEACRLYVGNLPFTTTSAEVSEIFAEAGHVVSVEVIYDRGTGKSRGFAFVTMGSVAEANEAMRLFDGAEIGGRNAKVNFPEVPRGGERDLMRLKAQSSSKGFVDSPFKIYAANLSWSITSQALRETFEQLPGFLGAKVIFDRDTGRSRGFGFITFSSADEAESALEAMNGADVEGRPLRLELAEQRTPSAA